MKIFCSGIGGIGLSAYAAVQRARGHEVYGSDRSDSALLRDLRGQGIVIALNQDGSIIPSACDLFVYSEAISPSHPERRRAMDLAIPCSSYFQALGDLSRPSFVIAVCGTHGKSSTTAMAAQTLLAATRDPMVIVGTKVPFLDGRNWRQGDGEEFLLEACEYRRSFLHLSPDLILCTTIDGDHFDYYRDTADYQSAFGEFFSLLPSGGVIVTHGGDPACAAVAAASGRRVFDADAFPFPSLAVPGRHMQENAQLVLGMCAVLGIPLGLAECALADFRGTWRRMEVKGECAGVTVIDDYGHHPREIAATLAALRGAYSGRRVVVVFQPHTHDRTLKLYEEFCTAFRGSDCVIIADVYDARSDIETATVDVPRFVRDIAQGSETEVLDGQSLPQIEHLLRQEILQRGDLLLCMGAGDITELAERMTRQSSRVAPVPQ